MQLHRVGNTSWTELSLESLSPLPYLSHSTSVSFPSHSEIRADHHSIFKTFRNKNYYITVCRFDSMSSTGHLLLHGSFFFLIKILGLDEGVCGDDLIQLGPKLS